MSLFDRNRNVIPQPLPLPGPVPFTATGFMTEDGVSTVQISDHARVTGFTYTRKKDGETRLAVSFNSFVPAAPPAPPVWGQQRR